MTDLNVESMSKQELMIFMAQVDGEIRKRRIVAVLKKYASSEVCLRVKKVMQDFEKEILTAKRSVEVDKYLDILEGMLDVFIE